MKSSGMDEARHPARARKARTDRRDATAPRLQYQALVEVGAGSTGGFEAESVDVSLDGMRMRTAYMPQEGERLVCRFDGCGGEILAEGEVIWLEEHGRGGEFGVRFTNLDQHAFGLLEELCELPAAEEEAPEPAPSSKAALPGARVRLHISGLGSPMRARVRETARGEVLIGSNLEFLKVGRDVELEDVERSRKRIAHIEHVGVDIDPETNVPQLVVALSYERTREELRGDDDLTTAPFQVGTVQREQESTPEPTVIDSEEPLTPSIGRVSLSLGRSQQPGRVAEREAITQEPPPAAPEGDHDDDIDEAELSDPSRPASGPSVQDRVGAMARALAPRLKRAGHGAATALGGMLATLRQKRAERAEEKAKTRAPKRTTAPPPSGALRSDGRRLIRDRHSDAPEAPADAEAPKPDRKRAIFGGALGVLAVLAIYFASSQLSDKGAEAEPEPAAQSEPSAAPLDVPEVPAAPAGDIPTAEVPLFGATPLSTTEPVPVPPDPDAAAPGDAEGEAAPSDEPEKADKPVHLDKEWGVGEVTDPTVLRLKMDGNIDGITGSETATGFTIVVPGRKSISSAAGFKAKDKRLDTVNVVNYPDRAEITLLFKKDVPAFVARAQGKRLIIEIATAKKAADEKTSSSKDKKKKKKK